MQAFSFRVLVRYIRSRQLLFNPFLLKLILQLLYKIFTSIIRSKVDNTITIDSLILDGGIEIFKGGEDF